MISIRAGYFNVITSQPVAEMAAICGAFVTSASTTVCEVEADGRKYRLTDAAWDSVDGILTGTIWRVREKNLPAVLNPGQMDPITNPIAEPASFAYCPSRAETLFQFNANGARQSTLRAFLEKMGAASIGSILPVIREGTLAMMQSAAVVRRVEFAYSNPTPHGRQILEEMGGAVAASLHSLLAVQGTSIKVEISLGHDPGSLHGAKQLAARLAEFYSSAEDAVTGIKTIKVGVKETEAKATQMLDLIAVGCSYISLLRSQAGNWITQNVATDSK